MSVHDVYSVFIYDTSSASLHELSSTSSYRFNRTPVYGYVVRAIELASRPELDIHISRQPPASSLTSNVTYATRTITPRTKAPPPQHQELRRARRATCGAHSIQCPPATSTPSTSSRVLATTVTPSRSSISSYRYEEEKEDAEFRQCLTQIGAESGQERLGGNCHRAGGWSNRLRCGGRKRSGYRIDTGDWGGEIVKVEIEGDDRSTSNG